MIKKLMLIVLSIGLIFLFSTGNVMAETATLKIGSHLPSRSVTIVNLTAWIKKVEKEAEGTLKFKTFWGGALTRDAAKQYELMMNGIQDASIVLPSYTKELFPDFSLFTLPYLFDSGEEGAEAQWRMYEKGLLTGLEKVYPVAIFGHGNSALHLSKAITSPSEVKGLKIRATGPEDTAIIKAMGGVAVGMGMSQVAEALNRGVIQGTLSGWNANRVFKLTSLLKTHLEEPFGAQTYFFIITKKAYDKLPAKAKQVIVQNSGLELSRTFGKSYDTSTAKLRDEALADPKRTVLSVSKAEQKERFAQIFKPFHDEWIETHKNGQRNYDALMEILADMRK